MDTDATLFRRWRLGRDEQAFRTLAELHADLVVDVARAVAGDALSAQDALQEALLKLALETSDRPERVGVRAWIARAAISQARNARASARARTRREQAVARQPRPEVDMVEGTDQQLHVRRMLAVLTGEERALVTLRFVHGLTHRELAEAFAVREGTLRVRLHRSLERLRGEARGGRLPALALIGAAPRLGSGAAGSTVEVAVVSRAATTALARAAAVRAGSGAGVGLLGRLGSLLPKPAWIVGACALGSLALGVTLLAGGSGAERREDRDVARAQPDEGRAGPTLAGVPRSGGTSSAPASEAAGPAPAAMPGPPRPVAKGKGPAAPAEGATGDPYLDKLPRVRVRLELEGTGEPLALERVGWRGSIWGPDMAIPVEPGVSLFATTDDPRAAIGTVTTVIPSTVPAELLLRVPRRNDSRLERLTLRAVDSVSGAPLPRAFLDLGSRAHGEDARLIADAEGRIRVDIALLARFPGVGQGLEGLTRLRDAVFAPDHLPPPTRETVPAVSQEDLVAWLERGELEVALEPLEADVGKRACVRLLRASGEAARGVAVDGLYPAVGYGYHRTALRSDATGLVCWERAPNMFGLVIYDEGAAASYVVMKRGHAERSLTLPEIVEVEVEIAGFPPQKANSLLLRWTPEPEVFDGLDKVSAAHVEELGEYFVDGVARPPSEILTKYQSLPWQEGKTLPGAPARVLCRLPLGRPTKLIFVRDGRSVVVTAHHDGERILVAQEALTAPR